MPYYYNSPPVTSSAQLLSPLLYPIFMKTAIFTEYWVSVYTHISLKPASRTSICRQRLVHNFPFRNILRDSLLETGGIVFYLLQVFLCRFRPQGKVCPCPISVQMWHLPRQPPYLPMVNYSHRLPNPRGHDPRLRPIEEHHLNHRGVNNSWHPIIRPIPSKHLWHVRPFLPRSSQVPNRRQPVFFWCR